MKRFLLAVLAVLMCVSLCACAEPIKEEELVGSWSVDDDDYIISFSFTDAGTFGYAYVEVNSTGTNLNDFESGSGTYEIKGNKVILDFEKSHPFDSSEMVYKDGKLEIDDHIFTKSTTK